MEVADTFAIIFTAILLVGFMVVFLTPTVIKEKKEEIRIKNEISFKENLFVLDAFLNTPVDGEKRVSDLINLFLKDDEYEDQLATVSEGIFRSVYGSCYGLEIEYLRFGALDEDKKVCIDYPNSGYDISICLDISDYEKKLEEGNVGGCWDE